MTNYKGNLSGMNGCSLKFNQSQRDVRKEGEMLGKIICREKSHYSLPIKTKEGDGGDPRAQVQRLRESRHSWRYHLFSPNFHLSVQRCVALRFFPFMLDSLEYNTVHQAMGKQEEILLSLWCILVLVRM